MVLNTTPSSTVNSTLSFYVPPADGSEAYYRASDSSQNYTQSKHEVAIENVRGKEDQYTLDNAGFQWLNAPAKHKAFQNDEEVKNEYYPESVELLKKATGASRVVFFDHTIRRRRPEQVGETPQTRQPAAQVHGDQTAKGAIQRVHRHMTPEEAPELLKKRFQIINLWRPISHPAWDWPLALCDYRSVDVEKDAKPVSLILKPEIKGEIYGILHNPNQQWKYVSGMTPDEAVLIKCYDSIQDGSVAVFTPHTAFEDPTTPSDAPKRESIEMRALVFYD